MLQDPKRANGQTTKGQGHSTTTKPTRKANEPIPYDEAVKEGRALRKEQNGTERRIQLRLGELAARVETKYADRTLAKFAKELGFKSNCTLERYRNVYDKWDGMGIVAPGPVSYSVLRALQKHPDREQIVQDNPQITKSAAAKLMRDYKEEHEGKSNNNKSHNEQAAEIKRLLGQFHSFAIDAKRVAEAMQHNAGLRRDVRKGLEPKLLAMLQDDRVPVLSFIARCLGEADS